MIMRISRKLIIIVLLIVVILSASTFGAYAMLIRPILKEQDEAMQTLEVEKQVLQELQVQTKQVNNRPMESSTSLQRKVPVKPLLEQLVLLVERAEVVSNSSVKNIKVTEDGQEEGVENSKKTLLEVKVKYETYEKMQKFIEVLQSQERIVHIDTIDFVWNIEEKEEEQTETTYTVTMAAFHARDLEGLEDGIPKVDIPKSSEKKNPLKPQ
jgi:type IV pilus assembly protein PilO